MSSPTSKKSICLCNIGLKVSKFCLCLALVNVIAITILGTYMFSQYIFRLRLNPDASEESSTSISVVPIQSWPTMGIQEFDAEEFVFVPVFEETRPNFNDSRRDFKFQILKHNNFWLLKNYYRASHDEVSLSRSITFATHGDYSQLENLVTLVERWHSPISVALYAPGEDFKPTVNSINYLLTCVQFSPKIHQLVTFHIYFNDEHVPNETWRSIQSATKDPLHFNRIDCTDGAPYQNVQRSKLYSKRNNLLYPINIGRNIAREAALTHFILEAEINMYPNMDLSSETLEIAESEHLQSDSRKIFALPVFRIDPHARLPTDKNELGTLMESIDVRTMFANDEFCYKCNDPKAFGGPWIMSSDTERKIFSIFKRRGMYRTSEPYFIGTNDEPYHNERFSREGGLDRSAQAYVLCALDYNYYVLNNAFLMFRDYSDLSMAIRDKTTSQRVLANRTRRLLTLELLVQFEKIYGKNEECFIH